MNKSFQLIRTNPKLTSNFKLVVSSDDKIYLESFNSCKELSDLKYKHKPLTKDDLLGDTLPGFYDGLPINLAFTTRTEYDVDVMYDNYESQFDNIYFSGADEIEDQWHIEEFDYLAPIYIKKNNLPEKFIILRVDDAAIYELQGESYKIGALTNSNFRTEILNKWKCISIFDLTPNSNIGKFLDNSINNNTQFSEFSFFLDMKTYNYSIFGGMDYNTGVYMTKSEYINDKLYYENLHFNLEEFVTNGFVRNNLIYPYILNMKFLFDDDPSTPEKFNKYSMNRYYGFYVDKFELVKSITTYDLPIIDNGLTIKNNIFLSGSTLVNPFKNKSLKSGWIQLNNKIYQIVLLSDLKSYKIISDVDFTNYDVSNCNNNVCKINYTNGKNYITGSTSLNIDYHKNSDNVNDYMYADLYVIEINGIYHVLKSEKTYVEASGSTDAYYKHVYYIQSDYAIISNTNELKYWKGGIENIISTKIYDNINSPISYNIYRIKFTDIKDFDFDRINTKYSDFDYEKSTYVNTEELKLSATEYRDNSYPRRKKLHQKNENGQYKLMNISSEYSAGDETFELRFDGIIPMWEKNQSISKWGYIGSISHCDYSYKLNNSLIVGGVYNRTTNTDIQISNVTEKSLDYFYRIGEFYGKSYDYIISGFTGDSHVINNWSGDMDRWSYSSYVIVDNFHEVNKPLTYNFNIERNKYYYVYLKLKITDIDTNFVVGISPSSFLNATTNVVGEETIIEFIGQSQGTSLILKADYANVDFYDIVFKEIEDRYYLNQSTNIQTKLQEKFDTSINNFNLDYYIKSDFDYFDFFFNNIMYYQVNGVLLKKPYTKYSYFNGGDTDLPTTSLFKGIEYKLYRTEDMIYNIKDKSNNRETIRNVITQGGEYYNGYKMSVILSENYNYVKYDKNSDGEYSNPITGTTVSKSIYDYNNVINKNVNGLHVFVNEKFKNVLIIININIPINQEWSSLNNVDVFGENYGLYYGKTIDNKYKLLPLNDGTIREYYPNVLAAHYYTQALNTLNNLIVFDEYVTYYCIDEYGKFGKVTMTRFADTITNTMSGLTNWNNNFPPFYIEVNTPYDLELKKNSYNTYPIQGPDYNISTSYTVYSKNMPLSQSIIDQPLGRYIDIDEVDYTTYTISNGETISNTNKIKRFNGYYEPIFNNITMFNPTYYWNNKLDNSYGGSISTNYVFADNLSQFAQINELMYSKANEEGNYLKLKDSAGDKSFYPMTDEIGLSQTSRNILMSPWDRNFHIKTLNQQTLLSDFVEVPFYVNPAISSMEITSVEMSTRFYPAGGSFLLLEGSNIYGEGYNRDIYDYQEITYKVTVKNTSTKRDNYRLFLEYKYVNPTSEIPFFVYDVTDLAPDGVTDVIFTVKKPILITSGPSLSEYSNWKPTITVYLLTPPFSLLKTFSCPTLNVYNNIINYQINSTSIPTGIPEFIQGTTYNDFNLIFTDITSTTQISSNYIAELQLLNIYSQWIILSTKTGNHLKDTITTVQFNGIVFPIEDQTSLLDTNRKIKYIIRHSYDISETVEQNIIDYEEKTISIRKIPTLSWNSINLQAGYLDPNTDQLVFNVNLLIKNTSNVTSPATTITPTFILKKSGVQATTKTVTLNVNALSSNNTQSFNFSFSPIETLYNIGHTCTAPSVNIVGYIGPIESTSSSINGVKITPRFITWANETVTYGYNIVNGVTPAPPTNLNTPPISGIFQYTPSSGVKNVSDSPVNMSVIFTPNTPINYNSSSINNKIITINRLGVTGYWYPNPLGTIDSLTTLNGKLTASFTATYGTPPGQGAIQYTLGPAYTTVVSNSTTLAASPTPYTIRARLPQSANYNQGDVYNIITVTQGGYTLTLNSFTGGFMVADQQPGPIPPNTSVGIVVHLLDNYEFQYCTLISGGTSYQINNQSFTFLMKSNTTISCSVIYVEPTFQFMLNAESHCTYDVTWSTGNQLVNSVTNVPIFIPLGTVLNFSYDNLVDNYVFDYFNVTADCSPVSVHIPDSGNYTTTACSIGVTPVTHYVPPAPTTYTLVITNVMYHGTTNPSPGTYIYTVGTVVTITYDFDFADGSAWRIEYVGGQDWYYEFSVTLTMDRDYHVYREEAI